MTHGIILDKLGETQIIGHYRVEDLTKAGKFYT